MLVYYLPTGVNIRKVFSIISERKNPFFKRSLKTDITLFLVDLSLEDAE